MHLVISTYFSLFWVVYHPSKTFLPKEIERESQNRLSHSPSHQTIPSLTFGSWPTMPVLAGYKWLVPKPCAFSILMWVHGLFAVHLFAIACEFVWSSYAFLLLIFNLLWCGWVWVFILCISFPSWAIGLAWARALSSLIWPLLLFIAGLWAN